MPCPDICAISNEYGDPPYFYHTTIVKSSRKPFKCSECREQLPIGTSYEKVVGKWDDEISIFRTCPLCQEIRSYFSCDGTWTLTSVWEELRENLFPSLTFDCLSGTEDTPPLSIPARQKVIAKWQRWKGLIR